MTIATTQGVDTTADILVDDQGSVVRFKAGSSRGKAWFSENVEAESWQYLGGWLCVDHRMAQALVDGIESEGLSIGQG